jgi:hypothetical protein
MVERLSADDLCGGKEENGDSPGAATGDGATAAISIYYTWRYLFRKQDTRISAVCFRNPKQRIGGTEDGAGDEVVGRW